MSSTIAPTASIKSTSPEESTGSARVGSFNNMPVRVAEASDSNHFVESRDARPPSPLPDPRPIRTIRIVQQDNPDRAIHHVMTDAGIASNPRGNTSLHNEEAIKEVVDHLAALSTPAAELTSYILNYDEAGNISGQRLETFTTLADYNEVLDKQMLRIADLGDKLNKYKASAKQAYELNALLKSHKHNLSAIQAHLSHLAQKDLTPEERTIVNAFAIRFAERHMDLANFMSAFSDILPEQEPISKEERIDYSLMQAKGCLRALKKMDNVSPRVVKEVEQHCTRLEQHAKFQRGEFTPGEDTLSLDLLTEDFSLAKDKKKLSSKVLNPLSRRWDEFSSFVPKEAIPLTHPKISQPTMIRLFVEHQLKAQGVAKRDMPDVDFLLKQGIIEEINDKEWQQVNKEMTFRMDGKTYTANSTITPASHLAKNFGADYPSQGISSMDRMQYKHVPNMAHSKMIGANDEVTFSGIRHGVLDPYLINDKNLKKLPDARLSTMIKDLLLDTGAVDIPSGRNADDYATDVARQIKAGDKPIPDLADKLRTESSKMMAKELLTAAVVSDPEKMQAALEGESVDVSLNSISLVTPDLLRAYKKPGTSGDEKTMLEHQTRSLKDLAAQGEVKLQVRDQDGISRTITVKPKVRTFNFGVNKGAVATSYKLLGPKTPFWGRLMGWGFSAGMNDPELRDLLGNPRSRELGGAVAERITQLSESGDSEMIKQSGLLRQAATQAKEIWASGSFRSGGSEPYKMVSRLALVSHLMGETPLYNCKSGKDRTGQLDAEVKYLASVGNITGRIPRPDAEHTLESRRMRTDFALNTGNHEMQQMTVGLRGYKLKGVPGLNQMLREDMMDIYRGGSAFVKT